ncbi:hypothetical protein FVE85_9363 [Porphyridium purpureum]|uniref:Uncharacterized protein n=1 Tax=Porphyridium purpureum TaxID=35688 RepID=A0A5J4YNI3_PORPP|nr:hypothetical protein FVE85_9363 [Porphyridium purpureum]|eukprot:POR6592..scf222_8
MSCLLLRLRCLVCSPKATGTRAGDDAKRHDLARAHTAIEPSSDRTAKIKVPNADLLTRDLEKDSLLDVTERQFPRGRRCKFCFEDEFPCNTGLTCFDSFCLGPWDTPRSCESGCCRFCGCAASFDCEVGRGNFCTDDCECETTTLCINSFCTETSSRVRCESCEFDENCAGELTCIFRKCGLPADSRETCESECCQSCDCSSNSVCAQSEGQSCSSDCNCQGDLVCNNGICGDLVRTECGTPQCACVEETGSQCAQPVNGAAEGLCEFQDCAAYKCLCEQDVAGAADVCEYVAAAVFVPSGTQDEQGFMECSLGFTSCGNHRFSWCMSFANGEELSMSGDQCPAHKSRARGLRHRQRAVFAGRTEVHGSLAFLDSLQDILDAKAILLLSFGIFSVATQYPEEIAYVHVLKDFMVHSYQPSSWIYAGMYGLFEAYQESPGIKGLDVFHGVILRFSTGKSMLGVSRTG